MATDRVAEMIREGRTADVLSAAVGAMFAAEEGRFCECAEPVLHGRDLMCGSCLLENQGQREARERAMREPHPFERGRGRLADHMCGLCSGWKDNRRHTVARSAGSVETRGKEHT